MPLTKSAPRVSLQALAVAAMMSVALPAAALAQEAPRTRESAPRVESPAAAAAATEAAGEANFSIDIPTVDTVDSNMDEATIRAILTGGLADHATELAGLNAKSISIPEITLSYSMPPMEGKAEAGKVVYSDVVLTDVVNGVAASVAVGGASVDAGPEGSFTFGKMSTGMFDIGGMLAFYGMVPGASADQPLKTIYKDFKFEGGKFTAPEATCTIGEASLAEFKARPLKTSFSDLMALAQGMEARGDDKPTAEEISQMVSFYADFLNAFESTPFEFTGLDCTGTSEDGKPVTVAVGPITIGGFSKNTYPQIEAKDIKVNVEGDGYLNLASVTFKSFDFSSTLAALEESGGAIDDTWLEANGRRLIPSFGGFAFTGLDMDMPDTESPGERIQASVGSFDLSLGNYINGVPADIASTAKNIVVSLPADSEDEGIQQLLTLGIDKIEAGYNFAATWDEPSNTIAIKDLSFDGANLGALALAGTIGNATPDLFALDNNTALFAAMGLTVKDAKVDVKDAGLADIVFQKMATEQGQTVDQVRSALSGVAGGTALALLGGGPDAQKLSGALASFLTGNAKSLSVSATAKNEAGLGLPELTALQSNPMALSSQVTVDATAQ